MADSFSVTTMSLSSATFLITSSSSSGGGGGGGGGGIQGHYTLILSMAQGLECQN